jgi:glyceraldehyde 3-phosphate dehydrogenase
MPTRIGLTGLGRVSRNIFRILQGQDDIVLTAICDPAEKAAIVYLLRFDTILGRFPGTIEIDGDDMVVGDRRIRLVPTHKPGDVNWGDLGVETVIETIEGSRTRADLERHLAAGAHRVILCSPPLDPPDVTVVMGVNDDQLEPGQRIVSNASATANAAAPVLRILNQSFGIERGFLSTVHAYTNQQHLADVPSKDPRRGRAAAENIIPQHTNSADVIMGVLPKLQGKLSGLAMSVPVANGSAVDMVCWHERPVTIDSINAAVLEGAADPRLSGVIAYENEPIVSSDIVRSPVSGTFDSLATMVLGDHVSKTVVWFDNGWGYANRVIELVRRFRALDGGK